MNLTINPLNFKNSSIYFSKKKGIKKEENCHVSNSKTTIDYLNVLKNQILFKGNIDKKSHTTFDKTSALKQEAINKAIKKYNLPISSETMAFVFNRNSIQTQRFDRYRNIGKLAYTVYARENLYRKFPNKNTFELTKIEQEGCVKQIANTVKKMFDRTIYKDDNYEMGLPLGQYFYALLGAIVEENKDDGEKKLREFLDNHASKFLEKYAPNQQESQYEALIFQLNKLGVDMKDVFIEAKYLGSKCETKLFYQKRLIAQVKTSSKNSMKFGLEAVLKEAICVIQKRGLDEILKSKQQKIDDYRKIDKFRKAKLEKFASQYGLNFNDCELLNCVFLYGMTAKGVLIQYHDSYENIEYFGDSILEYCVHKIIAQNSKEYDYPEIIRKLHGFTKNLNLKNIAKKMNFGQYVLNASKDGSKCYADMFEALIAAIYLDDKDNGLNNVYDFINNNFRDEILNM